MTRRTLRSSTALALTLALAAPMPLAAQSVPAETLDLDDLAATCDPALLAGVAFADEAELGQVIQLCIDEGVLTAGDAEVIIAQVESRALAEDAAEDAPEEMEDAEAGTVADEVEDALDEAVEEAPSEAETLLDEEEEDAADAAEAVLDDAEIDVDEEAEAPEEAVDPAEVAAEAGAEMEAEALEEAVDPAEVAAEAEAEAGAEMEAEALEEAVEDAVDALEPQAEEVEADDAEAAVEEAAEPGAVEEEAVDADALAAQAPLADDASEDEDAEAAGLEEGATAVEDAGPGDAGPGDAGPEDAAPDEEADAPEPAEAGIPQDANADPEPAEPEAVEDEAALEGALEEAEVETVEVAQEDTEETAARASVAPSAAAAQAEPDEADGTMETQTLTEEDTRASDEEFTVERRGDGLSRFEQALLLGVGAATVGALLRDGGLVVENTGDRVVVEREGELQVLKDDDELLRRPGAQISQRTYDDGSTLTVVEREDGTRVTTIRAANGQVLRRARTLPDGTEIVLFDDTRAVEPVDLAELRRFQAARVEGQEIEELRAALASSRAPAIERGFTLQQIRQIRAVRELMPQIEVRAIEFDTGSAVVRASEAEALRGIGEAMAEIVEAGPDEVFLVEGHTDAVGSAASNLALSDRRAESVALALAEYFGVPPENMVIQGYGESNLLVQTEEASRENRRAVVRRITPLLQEAQLQ